MKSTQVRRSSRIKSQPEASTSKARLRILSSSSSEDEPSDSAPGSRNEDFNLRLSSSDSSSDEVEPATALVIQTSMLVNDHTSEVLSKTNETEEHSDTEDESPSGGYFDFSQILNSQKEVKVAAQLLESKQIKQDAEKSRKDPLDEVTELLKKGEKAVETKVASRKKIETDEEPNVPEDEVLSENIEIKIQLPSFVTRNKKRAEMLEAEMKKQFNAARRKLQLFLHKVGLLCCLGRGFYMNEVINDETTQCLALSIIPSSNFYPPAKTTLTYVEKLVKWYTSKYIYSRKSDSKPVGTLPQVVENVFKTMSSSSPDSYAATFVALCRVLGLKCRLILSLQPPRIRPTQDDVVAQKKKVTAPESDSSDNDDDFVEPEPSASSTGSKKQQPSTKNEKKGASPSKKLKTEGKKKAVAPSKKLVGKKTSGPLAKKARTTKQTDIDYRVLSSDEDVDWVEERPKKRKKSDAASPKKKQQSVSKPANKRGVDVWAEVYVEADSEWICVDVIRGLVNGNRSVAAGCSKPLLYVIAWNADDTIKDVTRRYATQWLTTVQKLRVDPDWWDEVLEPWTPRRTKMDKEEDKKLDKLTKETPLPLTISEYKDHPHFALKRHLLKFEAIYPPDAQPLGFVKKEPVYSRVCVVELHSRETWMRQAKMIRRNETAYKIVKARPKWDRVNQKVIKDLPLELFGYWQTEDYMPPPAVDGKVPRNEYGNVEMYKPSMLPPGTVHLQVPGLARIARKLGVDCAPALVGWEYHGGSSHPILDGFIVCEEDRDALLDLWNTEIDESAKRDKEKSQKRAKKNWKKLVKAVILRKRLARKYGFKFENLEEKRVKI